MEFFLLVITFLLILIYQNELEKNNLPKKCDNSLCQFCIEYYFKVKNEPTLSLNTLDELCLFTFQHYQCSQK
jgi:hypothetical protein